MDKKTYALTVLQEVHRRTMAGELSWKVRDAALHAEPVPSVDVMISYEDSGPDSAAWSRMSFTHPVGRGSALITVPNDPFARHAEDVAAGRTLGMINEIFEKVLLEPRRKQFDETMAKLRRG